MLKADTVGKVIKRIREEKHLSQDMVSTAAGIGRTHLSSIERGIRNPTLDTCIKISSALGIPAGDLIDAIEEEYLKS